MRLPGATYRNVYVGSEAAAKRVEASISEWIERRLRVNRGKSGRGRPWERQFLGFAIDREGRIELAERRLQQYKRKVGRAGASTTVSG